MRKLILLAGLLICGQAMAQTPFGAPVPRATAQTTRAAVEPQGPQAVDSQGDFTLIAELPVDEQLAAWAKHAGWTFKWYSDTSWKVIAPSSYGKDFSKAFKEVMDILMHDEGKPLRFAMASGNRVVEVFANDLR